MWVRSRRGARVRRAEVVSTAFSTRNRKRIEENPLGATFELRIGELRVYYDVEESSRMVNVIAVGIKERNRVRIGTEEVEL